MGSELLHAPRTSRPDPGGETRALYVRRDARLHSIGALRQCSKPKTSVLIRALVRILCAFALIVIQQGSRHARS